RHGRGWRRPDNSWGKIGVGGEGGGLTTLGEKQAYEGMAAASQLLEAKQV
ncbi:hypothetical protein L195_g062932, partial [Trifolium pratense]